MNIVKALFLTCGIAFFLLGSFNSHAQTPIDKQTANNFYKDCAARQQPHLNKKTQEALCACTSVQFMKNMTIEDIQIMQQNTPAGRDKLNHMILNVYAPCIQYPVQDLVGSQCYDDPKVDMIGLNRDKADLCSCIAEKTGEWFRTQGRALMADILDKDPHIYDLIAPVMEHKTFKQQAYNSLITCVQQ